MNITELTDSACRCLKDQCFTDSTFYINYRWYWNGFLKSTDADAEFGFQIVSDFLILKYGRKVKGNTHAFEWSQSSDHPKVSGA